MVSILAKMGAFRTGKRGWEERMRDKGQQVGVRTGEKLGEGGLSLGPW